jgi:hypothetical protein
VRFRTRARRRKSYLLGVGRKQTLRRQLETQHHRK